MTKVAKIQLYYADDDILEFTKAQEALWEIQKEVRIIANRTVQMCWEFANFESDWKKNVGEYLTNEEKREVLGKSLTTLIADRLKPDVPRIGSDNRSSTIQAVYGKFNSMKKDIFCGKASVPSYKGNMPIDLHNRSISINYENKENGGKDWFVTLSLFSRGETKRLGLPKGALKFKAVVPARSKKYVVPILERCYDGEYKVCGSKLKYDNGRWYLLLCFSFEKDAAAKAPDKNNIMGVHIGEHNAVTCTFSESSRKLTIDGGEVAAFAAQIEKRKRSIGNASKKHSELCGDGRVGHGYHSKMKPLDNIGKKISNFRNTVNHRYSRQIVNWAVQNNCGTIQIEDLTGFASNELEKYKLLKNWSYYDLQTKIESKAKEYGIEVVKVGYMLLRRWCPDCQSPTVKKIIGDKGEESYVCETCGKTYDFDTLGERSVAVPNITERLQTKKDE
ncbi:MAG: RNA-guided endonuclease TnpB family protein [Eubacterium sp.]|nr:RNA-guided endonuclease TnpB family protein [Eubacterium sp.]